MDPMFYFLAALLVLVVGMLVGVGIWLWSALV